jgi:hypothetical protein
MSAETQLPTVYPACLVQIRAEPAGQYTARLVGQCELSATAPTRAEAVDQLRAVLRQQFDEGSLQWVEIWRENPIMSRFGYAKDDPDFDIYLEEIRKFREEMDLREQQNSGPGECPDTSLTPTT